MGDEGQTARCVLLIRRVVGDGELTPAQAEARVCGQAKLCHEPRNDAVEAAADEHLLLHDLLELRRCEGSPRRMHLHDQLRLRAPVPGSFGRVGDLRRRDRYAHAVRGGGILRRPARARLQRRCNSVLRAVRARVDGNRLGAVRPAERVLVRRLPHDRVVARRAVLHALLQLGQRLRQQQ